MNLGSGWNWVSTYIIATNSIVDVAATGDPAFTKDDDNLIKSSSAFSMASEDPPDVFQGSLTAWDYQQTHLVKSTEARTITFHGIENTDPSVPVAVGWNWISFPLRGTLSLNPLGADTTAFVHSVGFEDGDLIKNSNSFRTMDADDTTLLGWTGSLTKLEAGNGYLIKVANAGTLTFVGTEVLLARSISTPQLLPAVWLSDIPVGDVTMSIRARVFLWNGTNYTLQSSGEVAAFNEVGTVLGATQTAIDDTFYLSSCNANFESDVTLPQKVYFKFATAADQTQVHIESRLSFIGNAVVDVDLYTAPPNYEVCWNIVNMKCEDIGGDATEFIGYSYEVQGTIVVSDGVCDDNLSLSAIGRDCTDCGGRCFVGQGNPTLQNVCPCFGKNESEVVSTIQSPPPSAPPLETCIHGENVFCIHNDLNRADVYYTYEEEGNNDPFTCNDGAGSGIPTEDGQLAYPTGATNMYAGTDCNQCGGRCCSTLNDCATGTHQDTSCACYGVVLPSARSLDPFSSSTNLERVVSALDVPPSPPHTPCELTIEPLHALVSHCLASTTKTGSNCSNVYDGKQDGLNSISIMGGDLSRSWVAANSINPRITLVFKQDVTINTILFTQRLYHGFNNQVTSISIVTRDSNGNVGGTEYNVPVNVASSGTRLNDGEVFTATVNLANSYSKVKRLIIYLSGVQDADDAGISELAIGHACESPPSPPSPPLPLSPAPPFPPPSPPLASFTIGSITGIVRVKTWISGEEVNASSHTATECAEYCGRFSSVYEFSFYQGVTPLPVDSAWCECYNPSEWTVIDGSPESHFVHGKAIGLGLLLPMISSTLLSSSYINVENGRVVPFTSHIAISSSFEVTLSVMTTASLLSSNFKNVLRIAPWGEVAECRPCIDVSATQVRAVYYTRNSLGTSWYKTAVADVSLSPNTIYTLVARMVSRRLIFEVHPGESPTASAIAEKSVGLSNSGSFPKYERVAVFCGSSGAGGIGTADIKFKPSSVIVSNTLDSHKHFGFEFDSQESFLHNSVKFGVGLEGPPLVQANSLAGYATASPNSAILDASAQAASFDQQSMLLFDPGSAASFHIDGSFNSGLTLCFRMKETMQVNTLFTTLAGYGSEFVIRYYAYFNDISVSLQGVDTRAFSGSDALASTVEMTRFCASSAFGGKTKLYKNGALVGVGQAGIQAAIPHQTLFSIGASSDLTVFTSTGSDRGFGGLIDTVALWGRQLSDLEIQSVL